MNASHLVPTTVNCQGSLHPQALEGIRLFNERQYWRAHEALEKAWLEEHGEVRNLYRGILQVGVAYYHVQRGNYPGVLKVAARSNRWLAPFPDYCLGIDIGQLRRDLEDVLTHLRQLGPERMAEFDLELLKPLVIRV